MWNFKRLGPKSRKPARPDDGELIAYLDGQLSPERGNEIQQLLAGSWELRSRLADIETDTKFYVDACAHDLPRTLPDKAEIWRCLQAAERVGNSRARPFLLHRLRSILRRHDRLIHYAVAAACVVLVIVGRTPVSTISAAAVLDEAESAEIAVFDREPSPVLHQALTARTGYGEADSASWEIWSSVKTAQFKEYVQGSQGAAAEMKSILHANHMDERRPLSLASYRGWRRHAALRQEVVSRAKMGDGEEAFRIDAAVTGPVPEEGILETSLFIRERDWHAVAQQFEVRSGSGITRHELAELGYEVVPLSRVSAAIFGEGFTTIPMAVPATAALPNPPAPPPLPTPLQLWSVELRARYALHRLGACTGEPITVTHTPERVEVRGLVETEERKQQLVQQLDGVDGPWLRTDIKTLQEVGESEGSKKETSAQIYTVIGPSASSGILPIESLLATASVKYETEEVTRLSNDAVSSARALLMEAWALQHLAERYGAAAPEEVDPNECPLLDAMVRDHTHALEEQNSRLLLVLNKFLPAQGAVGAGARPESGGPDWAGISGQTLATAKEIEPLALALFSHVDTGHDAGSSDTPDQVKQQAAQLDVKLAELKNYLGELEMTLVQGPLPVPALAQAKEESAVK